MSEKRYDLNWGTVNPSQMVSDIKTFPIWYYGQVVSNDDPFNADRIRVRIEGVDNDVSFTDELNEPESGGLPWCQPLMPKFINVIPKVGETVKIAVFDYRNKKIRREYIGPVIAQQRPPDLLESPFFPTKWRVEVSNYNGGWSTEPSSIDGDWKIYPDKDDIALLGRRNTDFILRNKNNYDEVILRAGKIGFQSILDNQSTQNDANVLGGSFSLNKKNPAYVTINYSLPQEFPIKPSEKDSFKKLSLDNDRSHINVVADKINLVTHQGSVKKGFVKPILKGDDILGQVKVENEKLHPLVYGDVLWDFLSVLRPYVESHIHKASRREPDGDITKNNLIKWFNDNMGSKKEKQSPDGTRYNEIENCGFLSKGVKTN